MKKLFTLLVCGSIAMTAGAQERQMSAVSASPEQSIGNNTKRISPKQLVSKLANKTTTGGDRWYNYFPYMDTTAQDNGQQGALTSVTIWQDTLQSGQYTSGLQHINMASVASILDPSSIAFNDSNHFVGAMKIGNSDAYTIDSVTIFGVYNFNAAKSSVIDTIRLSFVKGMGAASASDDIFSGYSLTGGHYAGKTFLEMNYDTILNYARSGTAFGTPSNNVQDVILTNTGASPAWGDTSSDGLWARTVALNTPLVINASGFAGMSISFKSGDPALLAAPASTLPGDTIFYSTGAFKYNAFRPLIGYVSDLSTDQVAQWAPYNVADSNLGLFGREFSVQHIYSPLWSWSTSAGASSLQYPFISWHAKCTTCGIITNTLAVKELNTIKVANAYPNPATAQLNVPFTLSQSAQVTVTLSNMMGQVVSSNDMGNVSSGNAVINTATLPAGVYFYSVLANGERSTGRVVVAH